MSKELFEDMSSVIQMLPMLADLVIRLVSLASTIQQLASDNIRTDRAVSRIMCHLLYLISPVEFEDYEDLLDDVYSNACGVLEACRHLA
jgi:hypothetical protein